MLVSLLLASALLAPAGQKVAPPVAAQVPAFPAKPLYPVQPRERGVLTSIEPLHCNAQTSLARQDGKAPMSTSPTWTPKDFPDAGWYHTVARQVDGCQVATPMALEKNAK